MVLRWLSAITSFQHARQGENEVVWRLDRTTGNVQWRKQFAVPFKAVGGGEYHGNGPKSCPVYANGRLFTMSINGTMSAWDASSGERLWQRNYDADFEKSYPNWGASTSPIVDGNNVIVHFGTDEAGSLVALDAATGREVWTHGKDGPVVLVSTAHGNRRCPAGGRMESPKQVPPVA